MENAWSTICSNICSRGAQLALTAFISGVVVGTTICALQNSAHKSKIPRIRDFIPLVKNSTTLIEYGAPIKSANSHTEYTDTKLQDYDEDLISEQLARNRIFLGDRGLQVLRQSFVVIVGCGGVGSWAATMLLRSGIGRIRLIDFDQVTLSSLNRHAIATLSDVGTPKVVALQKHLCKVAPWVKIEIHNTLWTIDTAEFLLNDNPTYVVDAIDNIETKVDLLQFCKSRGMLVISSMGAGCKSDPTKVMIGDISETTEDPLSRSTRRRLRIRGITTGIPVVYSTEKPGPGKASLMPLGEDDCTKGYLHELGVLPDFRVRVLPVLGTMPGFFGLCIANHILVDLAGYPMEYSHGKNRTKLYEDIQAKLVGLESRLRGNFVGLCLPMTLGDIGYIVEEVYKGKSVVSGFPTRLGLTRWEPLPKRETGYWGDKEHILKPENVVLMTKDEVKRHEKEVLAGGKSPVDVWGKTVIERVEQRRTEERHYSRFR